MLYAGYIIISPVSDFRRTSHKLIRYLSATHAYTQKKIPNSVYENLTSHITTIFTRCNLTSSKTVTTGHKMYQLLLGNSIAELN